MAPPGLYYLVLMPDPIGFFTQEIVGGENSMYFYSDPAMATPLEYHAAQSLIQIYSRKNDHSNGMWLQIIDQTEFDVISVLAT